MKPLLIAALLGVMHVHHTPSHDSEAPFESVRDAAFAAGLDFLVLTEHVVEGSARPLPATNRAGLHRSPEGRLLLVLVGGEFGTLDGHLLGLDIPQTVRAEGRRGRDVIRSIHALGGFAVVPHPFSHGGWLDWEADFDGIEVQNNASDFRHLYGPLLPLRLLEHLLRPQAALRRLWVRPVQELEKWDELLARGRPVVGFAGADAHRNASPLGWQLDPYEQMFRGAQTLCPGDLLEPESLWSELRSGRCFIRYAFYESRRAEAKEVRFASGRVELQLDDGARVLEIRNPPADRYTPPQP